jgi:hypothetical protein
MIDREARVSVALDGETHSVRTLEEAEANEAQLWERLQYAKREIRRAVGLLRHSHDCAICMRGWYYCEKGREAATLLAQYPEEP